MHSKDNKYGSTESMKLHIFRELKDFCESTSLHGYNHLFSTDSKIAKIIWVIIILVATVCGIICIVGNTKSYMNATIVTNIDSSTVPLDVSTNNGYYQLK